MNPTASPYAVFRAEEWTSSVAQPIGIGQCLRLNPKGKVHFRASFKKNSTNALNKAFFAKHVQLAFA